MNRDGGAGEAGGTIGHQILAKLEANFVPSKGRVQLSCKKRGIGINKKNKSIFRVNASQNNRLIR